MAFEEQLPQWENEGTQPPQSKRVEGWQPNEKPPASWFNWLFGRAYKVMQELQQDAIHKDEKGAPDGVATLDDMGKVPSSQLPDIAAPVTSVNGKTGDVVLTASDVGAETPAGAQEKVNTHAADYVKHPGYATATGSANNYAVTLSPAPTAYVDGMAVAVKINVNNTGASTINVNGLGAQAIKRPNGNDVAAGNLKAGSIYTLRYNATTGNFILQGEGGSGNAQPGDVLSGKTFTNDDGEQTGTMPNRTGHVNAQSISRSGTTLRFRPPQGYFPGTSDNSVQWNDPNFIAANIMKEVTLFGLTGSLEPKQFASGQLTTSSSTLSFNLLSGSGNFYYAQVAGLTFKPKNILLTLPGTGNFQNLLILYLDPTLSLLGKHANGDVVCLIIEGTSVPGGSTFVRAMLAGGAMSVTSSGFILPVNSDPSWGSSRNIDYFCWG